MYWIFRWEIPSEEESVGVEAVEGLLGYPAYDVAGGVVQGMEFPLGVTGPVGVGFAFSYFLIVVDVAVGAVGELGFGRRPRRDGSPASSEVDLVDVPVAPVAVGRDSDGL